MLKKRP
jgi:hypothetical protein